jgi:hypothetical protein
MKKLFLILLIIPYYSLGQDIKIEEYYDAGNKIIEKTWLEGEKQKTNVKIIGENLNTNKYFITINDIEVSAVFYVVRDYGKYFKVDLSIVNNSQNRIDFSPKNIELNINGDLRKKEKYKILSYKEYKNKVERRQKINEGLSSFAIGFSSGNRYESTHVSYANARSNYELKKNQNDRMQFIDEGYLRNHTLFTNTTLEGYILIPFNRKITDIDLVLKIAEKNFDFSNKDLN